MKIFNAIGRLVANPLAAVVICAVGSVAIWVGAVKAARRQLEGEPAQRPSDHRG